jgi:glycosyltransferase 2 family protein
LSKKPVVLLVRIVLSAAMLAVLFWRVPDVQLSELVPDWRPAAALWALAAIALTGASVVLSAVRWEQVLHALEIPAPLRRLVSHYFAGQFVSNVLPTTIGGDLLRVARLSRENGAPEPSFASVVIERLTGWLVLPVMSMIGLAINRGLFRNHSAAGVAVTIDAVALIGLLLLLGLAANERLFGRFAGHGGWLRFLGAVHLGVVHLRQHRADAASVLLAGFAFQGTLTVAAFCAARVIGIDEAGLTAMLAFIPVVLMLQVLPIGISGLGIREAALVVFLSPLGVPEGQAIALGLALYLLNLLVSLVGAPAFAMGGSEQAQPVGHGTSDKRLAELASE